MSAAISKADDFKRRARNVFVYAPLTIATVGMIVGIGSTQFIAYQMGYDQILGPPLAGPVYLPWRFIQWWQSPLAAEYARPFLWLKVILMGLVILAMMVLSQGMKKKPQKHPTLRGSSRLAGIDELKAIQLLPPDGKPRYGIYLGAWKASRKELQYLILTMNYNVLTIGPPRSGKAQPLDAKVLTPVGFREIGTLSVGDPVTTPSGKTAIVTGVYPQGLKEIYRITFYDGRTVECCDDHLWKVWERSKKYETGKSHATRRPLNTQGAQWAVVPLSEIRKWFDASPHKSKRVAVPLVDPAVIEFPPKDQPIPPYVMGALLGDGSFGSEENDRYVQFTSADSEIVGRIAEELPQYDLVKADYHERPYEYRLRLKNPEDHKPEPRMVKAGTRWKPNYITFDGVSKTLGGWATSLGISEGAMKWRLERWTLDEALGVLPKPNRVLSPVALALRKMGLVGKGSHEKFIPEVYKTGSVAQRIALLQGLMDTDGSVGNGTHATFTSTSEQLANDVQYVAWSLGAIASIRPRQTYYKYKGRKLAGRPSWRVSIIHPDVSLLFSLTRKFTQCKPKAMEHRLRIMKIEKIANKEAVCISIDDPEHLYVTDNYVVTHNTKGILEPTILSYPYSMIIWDPKGEIYHSTAGWRAKEANNYVLRWAPADTENTVSWNPFSRVRAGTLYAYRDVANVVGKIANPDGKPATDHWEPTAANFLAGLAFYQLHTTGTATCSGMLAIIDASSDLSIILNQMATCADIYAAQVGRGMLATQDRERATIVSTSRRLLLPFRDPIIAKNTDTSDFVIEDLVNADRPVTLYIEVRGEDEDTVRPLIRLFLNLAVGVFSSQPPKYENGKEIKPWKWPLRGAIDEFAGLKEMKPFELALSKLPGYDITWILAVQDYQQIRKEYGDKEGITGQCQVIASYAANNQETREWLSKQAGKKTEIVEEVSESTSSGKRTQSVSLRHEQRDVITPDEIGRLKSPKRDVQGRITEPGDVLILHTGQYPIIAQQSLAFLNDEFKRRSNIPAPPTMTIRGTV